METISNQELSVSISAFGAEIQSVRDVRTGQEYWWNGDARFWSGRSPLLFPVVGRLWDDTARFGRTTTQIPKHGVVRKVEWTLVEQSETQVTYRRIGTVADFTVFPFSWTLEVTYVLSARRLEAHFRVINTGSGELLFQFGGHPALALPDCAEDRECAGFVQLEGDLTHFRLVGEQGCVRDEKLPLGEMSEGLVPLTVSRFAQEALIFDEGQVKAATLLRVDKSPVARVESTAPVWLFWRPVGENAPFVCPEPWYGLCDYEHYAGDFSSRPFVQKAAPGSDWTGGFSVEFF